MNVELVRAVVEAARTWRESTQAARAEGFHGELADAIDALNAELAKREPNRPTGSKIHRAWRKIPAGWFVYTPDGKIFEVLATEADGAFQKVTLRLSPDKTGTWPRPANGDVLCQRGTHGRDLDDAIETLATAFGKVEVIEDALPPWDE